MMDNLKQLETEYSNTKIPEELEHVVKQTIIKKQKKMRFENMIKMTAFSAASIIAVFIITVNSSAAAAEAMSNIPVVKNLVRLVMIRELSYQDANHEAKVEVPKVEGLTDKSLEAALNKKYLEENTKLYEDFMKELGDNELTPQNLALYTDYAVKVNTEDFMVVQGVTTQIAASGTESVVFDNIDLKNQLIITLPSLFKDDSYVDVISENIIEQMKQRMDKEEGVMFFIEADGDIGGFNKIKSDQSFYINSDSKLVISFNEYEVAPGVMGMVEFVIPTEVIQDLLVSNTYIR
jgi:hypothetical protein